MWCNRQKQTFTGMAVPLCWTPLDTTGPLEPLVFTDAWAFVCSKIKPLLAVKLWQMSTYILFASVVKPAEVD